MSDKPGELLFPSIAFVLNDEFRVVSCSGLDLTPAMTSNMHRISENRKQREIVGLLMQKKQEKCTDSMVSDSES